MYGSITNEDARWSRLEDCSDASAVVSRRMEVLYLNPAARSLVPPRWRGLRCWEVFPVRDRSCASQCPAIRAVQSREVFYCEEEVNPEGSTPVRLGVAVIPLAEVPEQTARAVLLLRPKSPVACDETFRRDLLNDAERLRASV